MSQLSAAYRVRRGGRDCRVVRTTTQNPRKIPPRLDQQTVPETIAVETADTCCKRSRNWVEETKDWLRLHRPAHRGNIGAGFLAAVIAHGDVPYTVGDEQRGIVWAVGLTLFGGKLASDAWRRVLDGQLMTPVAPERRFA
jgi:hypothetical protein